MANLRVHDTRYRANVTHSFGQQNEIDGVGSSSNLVV
jgi:hypothetical protein